MTIKEQEKLDHFRQVCRANKLSLTPQRLAVYAALIAADNHPSTDDIFTAVRAAYPDISMDTVYRTLTTFTQIGLVNLVEGYGEARRYDPVLEPHHHFRCQHCNAVIDFYDKRLSRLEPPAFIREKYTVSNVKVIVEGQCDRCRQQTKKETNR